MFDGRTGHRGLSKTNPIRTECKTASKEKMTTTSCKSSWNGRRHRKSSKAVWPTSGRSGGRKDDTTVTDAS